MGRPIFSRGKNGPAHSFPGEKTDWGEIPACYTGVTQDRFPAKAREYFMLYFVTAIMP